MDFSTKIYSFRTQITLLLILTLVTTTAVVYKLNQLAEKRILRKVEQQRDDLAQAINITQQSITSSQWLRDFLIIQRKQERLEEHVQVKRILKEHTYSQWADYRKVP